MSILYSRNTEIKQQEQIPSLKEFNSREGMEKLNIKKTHEIIVDVDKRFEGIQ